MKKIIKYIINDFYWDNMDRLIQVYGKGTRGHYVDLDTKI